MELYFLKPYRVEDYENTMELYSLKPDRVEDYNNTMKEQPTQPIRLGVVVQIYLFKDSCVL